MLVILMLTWNSPTIPPSKVIKPTCEVLDVSGAFSAVLDF